MARGGSNSWRPSDGPLSPQAVGFLRQQSPNPLERTERIERTERTSAEHTTRPSTRQYANFDRRLAPVSTQATPELPAQTFRNPNLMPVVPRRPHHATPSSPTGHLRLIQKLDEGQLPQIWHTSIDELIRRTAHDYDLVMNYERDAEGGQRWLAADIARIRNVGKTLHRDIFALRRWQRIIAHQGDQEKTAMMNIKRDANLLKMQCERIQGAITKYEQKCGFELLRDGVYAQDEDGNFYRPITPQQYVGDGGYLHVVPRPGPEGTGDDNRGFHRDHNEDSYQDCDSTARFRTPPYTEPSSPPKRSLAFDSAFQPAPLDRSKTDTVHQKSETAPQPTGVTDGRISKPYRRSSRGLKYRSPSPSHRDRSPDSTHSVLTGGIECRNRGRNSYYERDGVSRRQAKRDRAQNRSPRPTIGRLGKHKLHY